MAYAQVHSCPPALRKPPRSTPAQPPPQRSCSLLVRLAPEHTAMFRFLLEAYGHMAYFTVLERHTALLRLIFSPHCEDGVREMLSQIAQSLPLSVCDWPFEKGNCQNQCSSTA
ncbi:MAG: DUF4911 domain-containing protein [Desulfovibrio sp.]|nr:DUF4911 domain-containing protein [Desulfovibrio sp.]